VRALIGNSYYQLLCGEEFFQHRLPFDRSSTTRWRQRMGEEKLVALLSPRSLRRGGCTFRALQDRLSDD
jgi:hypothetical protein